MTITAPIIGGKLIEAAARAIISAWFGGGSPGFVRGRQLMSRMYGQLMRREVSISAAAAPRPVMGQPTPPYQSPTLIEAQRVLTESRKAPKKSRKRMRQSARREQWEKWIAIGRKQLPKGAGKKVGAIIRRLPKVPRAAGGVFGPWVAWEIGKWIGTEIYERGSAWYYGEGKRPTLPKPQPPPREHPHPAVTVRAAPSTVRPAAPRAAARPGVPTPRAAVEPKLERITVTAQRVPVPAPSPAPAAATVRASRAAQVKRAVAIASAAYALMPAKAKRRQSVGVPSLADYSAPLTEFQTQPLQYRERVPPKVKTKTCECEKPRKRTGRKACRNPIVSRRKRTRNGRQLITTTRELKCPQSSRKKQASAPA